MVCYLCADYTFEPLINCRNKKCKAYFHKSCWKKYLKVNNLRNTCCQMCILGKININTRKTNNGEVISCCLPYNICDLFRDL